MRVLNYDKEMDKILSDHQKNGERVKVLLHSCCAPCSTACLERLNGSADVTVYYYNPNLDTEKEFNLRASEQKRLCESLGVECVIEDYDKRQFLTAVKGLENEKEGGGRCSVCFYLRLKQTALKAKELNYDYFATTLTVSPLKNAQKLNAIGEKVQAETGVKFLPTDFKKKNGYLRSIELSKENGLYRQNYCGCEFSKAITIDIER
ncbi:MAG: epoxyqueuosine reductase QueH [Clostridia bacterium]|nr:epoxyqueuosine reductase QueH [Clostridia bacterium]